MDMKLELVIVPVSDVDRAKAFYIDQMGFGLHVDHQPNDDFRVVQLNPPGSACSIAIGKGINADMAAGSVKGLHLVVTNIAGAHDELVGRGVGVSEPYHYGMDGSRTDGVDPSHADYATFMDFADPDGNVWLVQEVGHAGSGQ
jgi:catechol 2,3-dioxygenase-like lactoylglutathione lyase family enzyme